ncbi:Ribonuclease H-like domain [Plasmopara halstedii]|uniref:Ribonuclease H-like domain n=1 Tax=Plasmopara halstedii TaxID=4781 RepID=A0A0P1ACB7_PLAHL|nr:Ribonuclease H-like domain [Plasmopara halstedii]CEG38084.1 Ribonuclease H-like domain [Plasmopara halstedii]|eukprot:XP_024574453.1 Ribonuclease H-like domain [Plasmopara halstedii]
MEKWGLDSLRLTKIIRDNGANIVKACNDLEVDHFGCVAHSLHLVVSGALSKSWEEVEAAQTDEQMSFGVLAEPDETDEQWVEDPEAELEAIGELEDELGLISLEVTSSVESVAESVDLETDDCMDEGLLDGCLSASAAVGLMDAMKKAMSETRKHVASFRKIVTFFNKSAKGKAKLKELQKVPLPLTVIADVATRWNSTHQMIERLLFLRPILQEFTNVGWKRRV